MAKLNYRSVWYSPNGFANEGTYICGTIEDMGNFFNVHVAGDVNCTWSLIKHHHTLDNAKRRCAAAAKRDISNHKACGEISDIWWTLAINF